MLNEMHLTAQKETIEKIQFNELNISGNNLHLFAVSLFPEIFISRKNHIGLLKFTNIKVVKGSQRPFTKNLTQYSYTGLLLW